MTTEGVVQVPTLDAIRAELRQGSMGTVEAMARARLASFPNEADSYDCLAISCISRGNLQEARRCLDKAVSLEPGRSSFQRNLGEICRRLGDKPAAIAAHQAAAALGHVSGTQDLALALMLLEANRQDEARVAIGRIDPGMAPDGREGRIFRVELSYVLICLGEYDQAGALIDELLRFTPGSVTLKLVTFALKEINVSKATPNAEAVAEKYGAFARLLLQADILSRETRHKDAAALFIKACSIDDRHGSLWDLAGTAYYNAQDYNRALAAYDHAIARLPNVAGMHYNRSISLRQQFRWMEAAQSGERAVELDPTNAEFRVGLGLCYHGLGRSADAVVQYEHALAKKPEHHGAMLNMAFPLMRQGLWQRGFEAYEARYKFGDLLRRGDRKLSGTLWQGESLEGKSLFIESEQGLGDTIEFSRFLLAIMAMNPSRVVFEVQPAMTELIRHSFAEFGERLLVLPRQRDWPSTTGLPQTDYHCLLLSLLNRLDVRLETLPKLQGYLKAPPNLTAAWQRQIVRWAPAGKLRVGVAWAGNPQNSFDQMRSPGIKPLLPLFDLPNVAFFSLQMKHAPDDKVLQDMPKSLIDLGRFIENSADMAAMMSCLDLIISPCTGPLHLAGALGRPAFGILASVADWRWLIDRTDCPWYPSLRLFRQPSSGDWASVVSAVKAELAALARARTRDDRTATAAVSESVEDISLRLFNAGAFSDAEAACREHLKKNPEDAAGWRVLGVAIAKQNREEEAIPCFLKAVELDPARAEHYFNLGTALMSLKRYDDALAAYEKALVRDPTNVGAICNSGATLKRLSRKEEALAMYIRAAGVDRRLVLAHYNIGLLALELGRPAEAKAALKICVEIDPRHRQAQELLAALDRRIA